MNNENNNLGNLQQPTSEYTNNQVPQQNNNPKKSNLGLIIGIAVAIILLGVGGFLLLNNKNNKENINNSNNSNNKQTGNSSDISQIELKTDEVVALTNNGDLYIVKSGGYNTMCGTKLDDEVRKPKLIAKNVKEFFGGCSLYIDKDDNLYVAGLNPIKNGTYDKYVKLGTNIKTVDGIGLGLYAVSNDGELYVFGTSQLFYNAIQEDDKLTKVDTEKKVVDVMVNAVRACYLNEDGEVYCRRLWDKKDFELVTDDSEYKDSFKIENNKMIELTYDGLKSKYPDDLKKMLQYQSNGGDSYGIVYVNNNNKIVLYDKIIKTTGYENGEPIQDIKENKEELDWNIKNISKILDFMLKY